MIEHSTCTTDCAPNPFKLQFKGSEQDTNSVNRTGNGDPYYSASA
jgi:hypothetical protein